MKIHYHFFASQAKIYNNPVREKALQEMLTDYAGAMEVKLKKYPEQWFNYYNFWQ